VSRYLANTIPAEKTEQDARERKGGSFHLPPPVERMVNELRPALAELAARGRRIAVPGQGAVILLTGCGREVGTSSLALALAWVAAEEYSVLLIDADMERAGLSRLASQKPSTDPPALEAPRRLSFLPLKPAVLDMDPALLLRSYRDGIIRQRSQRQLILLDGGSAVDGGSRWVSSADASILVCDVRRSPLSQWSRAWDELEAGGSQVLGVVEMTTSFPEYRA
jgi:Mrp family chromosome partitioning ATPase